MGRWRTAHLQLVCGALVAPLGGFLGLGAELIAVGYDNLVFSATP